MAKQTKAERAEQEATNRYGYWQEELAASHKRFDPFIHEGKLTVDRYKLEGTNRTRRFRDRYNILYSSTETIMPSLYAQTPKVMAAKRHRDRDNPYATAATMLIEVATQYAMEDIDFDAVMKAAVKDYALPGLGVAWVRYTPTFGERYNEETQKSEEYVEFDGLAVDYVHWRDVRFGKARVWAEMPWVAKRVYFTKDKATKRFGAEVANKLRYSTRPGDTRDGIEGDTARQQAVIWEIWHRTNLEVIWWSEDYAGDVIETKKDPLKLQGFWPTPEPMRAVWTTDDVLPQSFYSQYRPQAEELDNLTQKIRILTQAVRVIGLFDGSQESLQTLLAGNENKMVKVDNWAVFANNGGINGSIQWVPLKDIVQALAELLRQREVVKAEIYEITGFSDVVRGVSKASETLGAQQIKQDWASARLRSQQMEVQRYCRDLIRIMAEIICEQFSETSLMVYSGLEIAPNDPEAPQKLEFFQKTVELLRNEKQRCALIDVETDSTLLPDEMKEREDRMAFLGAIGAFMQQAGPMAAQYPDMRGLLGAIMMFSVRTFRASRPIEQEFEKFQATFANAPAANPEGEAAGAQAQAEQAKAQAEQAKVQAEQEKTAMEGTKITTEDATKRYEIDSKAETERQRNQQTAEFNMAKLAYEERKLDLEERKLGLEERRMAMEGAAKAAEVDRGERQENRADDEAAQGASEQAHRHEMDLRGDERAERELEASSEAENGEWGY